MMGSDANAGVNTSAASLQSAPRHTPGPWQIHSDYTLEGRTTVIGNVDGEIIDGTTNYTFEIVCDTLGDDDTRSASIAMANARLIVEAPRMLAALRKLTFAAQTTGGTAGRDEQLCAAIAEAQKVILAAAPASEGTEPAQSKAETASEPNPTNGISQ